MQKPIHLRNLSLTFPHKICFENCSTTIHPGDRIAITGRNGSGKTSLLKIFNGAFDPSNGHIEIPQDLRVGFVPQIIQIHDNLSGGQRVQKALTRALSLEPDLLLLDEPTNHLDISGKEYLFRMLERFQGMLIVVSHDVDLLKQLPTILWHIEPPTIHLFRGRYVDYEQERGQKRSSLLKEEARLKRDEKNMHHARMKEQKRANKSKAKGQKSIDQRKWPTVVRKTKAVRAEETTGRKRAAIQEKKEEIGARLGVLTVPEVITPRFYLDGQAHRGTVLQISDGSASYRGTDCPVTNINLFLQSGEGLHLKGENASGKSLVLKAILDDSQVERTGAWHTPSREKIGTLDQHYADLQPNASTFDHIRVLQPTWSSQNIRVHLNDFLFRKNEEITLPTKYLSGGEKVRLSLAMIAARTPKLLLLDEVTNNLDLETKAYLVQVLKTYPGAMIVVCHEEGFVKELDISQHFEVKNGEFLKDA